MTRRYKVFDVFTDRALAGNPLAVVLDAEGLSGSAMQAIAREFNLSETTFVLPAALPAHTARIRIFTPARELPFAGHPTVGTAVCLALDRLGGSGATDAVIVLEEKVGVARCGVRCSGTSGFAEFDCPKLPERSSEAPSKEAAAAALGLSATEIGFENHTISAWSAGVPYHFVPVANFAALARAAPNRADWPAGFDAFVYTRETEGHDHSFRARMFAPEFGIQEDPATGSAVAALAGAILEFDALRDGEYSAVIEQGYEMGRPSLIRLEMTVSSGVLANVRIGGDAVQMAEGVLHL